MIVQRIRGIRSLLALAQGILVSLLFWMIFVGWDLVSAGGLRGFANDYFVYWLIVLIGLGAELLSRRSDEIAAPMYDRSLVRQFPLATQQVVFAIGGLLLYIAFTKDHTISRVFLSVFAVLLYGVMLWSNAILPGRLARILFRGEREIATLLIGSRDRARVLRGWLAFKEQFGVKVIGRLGTSVPLGNEEATDVPYLGNVESFDQLTGPEVKQVIVLESADPALARRLIQKCQSRGIRLLIVNDFAEQIEHPIVCSIDDGVNLITLYEEPLENPFNRVMKRLVDVAIALFVVTFVLPPLCLLVWLLQRAQSKGPLFHRQPRSGLQNRSFEIIKFRTMHLAVEDLNRQATEGDERVFPSGRWLRHFSIDEFPQFLNVLRGEMSVVGPRPHLIEHNRQFAELLQSYHLRAFIKPGITGLAQVRGFRGEAHTTDAISARLQSDLIYLENWSLSLDFSIMMRTVWQIIVPPRTAV